MRFNLTQHDAAAYLLRLWSSVNTIGVKHAQQYSEVSPPYAHVDLCSDLRRAYADLKTFTLNPAFFARVEEAMDNFLPSVGPFRNLENLSAYFAILAENVETVGLEPRAADNFWGLSEYFSKIASGDVGFAKFVANRLKWKDIDGTKVDIFVPQYDRISDEEMKRDLVVMHQDLREQLGGWLLIASWKIFAEVLAGDIAREFNVDRSRVHEIMARSVKGLGL